VRHPEAYGVVEFAGDGGPVAIVEKPRRPPSHWAVTGLYFYDNAAPDIAQSLKPSARGELEITDLNNAYLSRGMLTVERLGRGFAWFDTGTHNSLLEASEFVRTMELRQGLKIACVEEVAYRMGYIDDEQLLRIAGEFDNGGYGAHLERLVGDIGDHPLAQIILRTRNSSRISSAARCGLTPIVTSVISGSSGAS
jgi:glucose-1-phosphate thymidylyltransferase